MAQGKFWCFTWNNFPENYMDYFLNSNWKYLVIGKEVGEQGTSHLQGYIEFETNQRLSKMKKIDTTIHWELRRGSGEQAATYCKKDGDYMEFGEIFIPKNGARKDIDEARQIIKETGRMKNVVEKINSMQAIRVAEIYLKYNEPKRNWEPEVYWFYGATGTGKTRAAFEMCEDPYVSGKNLKWWEGYDGHEDVIIDDFRKDFCTFHELLRILDRYEYRIEVKGASRQLLAKRIIITSCYRPECVYDTREDIAQLLRRIKEVRFFETGIGTGTEVGGNTNPDHPYVYI